MMNNKKVRKDGMEFVHFAGNTYVSKEGYVYNAKRNSISKGHRERQGYRAYTLTENGKQKTYKVHRMVAMKFLPNPDNKKEVNHLDGDKENNDVNNLEWVTPQENVRHAWATGLKPTIVTEAMREEIGKAYLETDLSQGEIAKKYNVSDKSVSRYAKEQLGDADVTFKDKKRIALNNNKDKIYQLYLQGKTKTEIASEMKISIPTVEKIVNEIAEKNGEKIKWNSNSNRLITNDKRIEFIEEEGATIREYIRLHERLGLTYREIGERNNLKYYTVRNKIRQYKDYCQMLGYPV